MTLARRPRRHRLYWRIWVAILVAVALFALLASTAWHLMGDPPRQLDVTGFAELASEVLPLRMHHATRNRPRCRDGSNGSAPTSQCSRPTGRVSPAPGTIWKCCRGAMDRPITM